MKTLRYIFGLLLVAGVAFAQGGNTTFGKVDFQLVNGGPALRLTWAPQKVDTSNGVVGVTYSIYRQMWYDNTITGGPDTTESKEIIKQDQRESSYQDLTYNSCFHFTYWITSTFTLKLGVVKEGPSSEAVNPQIKGGVNAVVIYPTPDVFTVTGSPITVAVQACDNKFDERLTYDLSSDAKATGLSINQDGVIHADHIHPLAGARSVRVTILAYDQNGGSSTSSFVIHVEPPSLASVAGVIHFGNNNPFPVTLKLSDVYHNDNTYTTKSDVDGHFLFENVAIDTYRLSYTAPQLGSDPHWYKFNAGTADSATLIPISEAHLVSLDGITIVRPEPRKSIQLIGKVRRLNDGGENIVVQAFEVSGLLHRRTNSHLGLPLVIAGASTVVGTDGSYQLALDTGSTYVLLASAAGYQSHFIGADATCASPYCAQAYSPRNDTTVSDSYIAPSDTSGQQISGNVSSLANASTGVRAMILLSSTGFGTITSGYSGGLVPFETVTSDDAGNFTINSVARDTTGQTKYLIQAVPFQDYVPSYYAANDSVWNTMLWEHAQLFAVDTVKKDPLLVNIHVQPLANGTGSINGHVVEINQEVESSSNNAYVYAVDQSSMTEAGYAVTDVSGNYTISNLPAGTYAIFADKISYHFGAASGISILSEDTGSKAMPQLTLSRGLAGITTPLSTPVFDEISSAYPNPFSDVTMFHVEAGTGATLKVYDMLGRECADLSAQLHSGNGFVSFHASRFVAGPYLVKLQDQRGVFSRQLMIVR